MNTLGLTVAIIGTLAWIGMVVMNSINSMTFGAITLLPIIMVAWGTWEYGRTDSG